MYSSEIPPIFQFPPAVHHFHPFFTIVILPFIFQQFFHIFTFELTIFIPSTIKGLAEDRPAKGLAWYCEAH